MKNKRTELVLFMHSYCKFIGLNNIFQASSVTNKHITLLQSVLDLQELISYKLDEATMNLLQVNGGVINISY